MRPHGVDLLRSGPLSIARARAISRVAVASSRSCPCRSPTFPLLPPIVVLFLPRIVGEGDALVAHVSREWHAEIENYSRTKRRPRKLVFTDFILASTERFRSGSHPENSSECELR